MRFTSGAVCFCLGFDGGMGGADCCGWGCFSPFLLTACSKVDIFSFLDSASWVIVLRETSSRHHLLHLPKHNLSCCLLWWRAAADASLHTKHTNSKPCKGADGLYMSNQYCYMGMLVDKYIAQLSYTMTPWWHTGQVQLQWVHFTWLLSRVWPQNHPSVTRFRLNLLSTLQLNSGTSHC